MIPEDTGRSGSEKYETEQSNYTNADAFGVYQDTRVPVLWALFSTNVLVRYAVYDENFTNLMNNDVDYLSLDNRTASRLGVLGSGSSTL
jgi:hypothetical protein